MSCASNWALWSRLGYAPLAILRVPYCTHIEIGSKISSFFGGSSTGDEVKDVEEDGGDSAQTPEEQAPPSGEQTPPPEAQAPPPEEPTQDTPSDEQPESKGTGSQEEEGGGMCVEV